MLDHEQINELIDELCGKVDDLNNSSLDARFYMERLRDAILNVSPTSINSPQFTKVELSQILRAVKRSRRAVGKKAQDVRNPGHVAMGRIQWILDCIIAKIETSGVTSEFSSTLASSHVHTFNKWKTESASSDGPSTQSRVCSCGEHQILTFPTEPVTCLTNHTAPDGNKWKDWVNTNFDARKKSFEFCPDCGIALKDYKEK